MNTLIQEAEHVAGPNIARGETFKEMTIEELADILELTICEERTNSCVLFLAMLSAFTEEDQLNVCILGQSSSGKTYLSKEVSKLFPQEDIREFGGISPTALKYWQPEEDPETGEKYVNYERIVLIFSDMPDAKALGVLRPLFSHDKKDITFASTTPNILEAKKITLRGFPVAVFCSANMWLDEQEKTRFLLLSPSTSDKKIQSGLELAAKRMADPEGFDEMVGNNKQRQDLMRRIEYIKSLHVGSVKLPDANTKVLPAFKKLCSGVGASEFRGYNQLCGLIKAIALLNAPHRMDAERNVVANDSDIRAGLKIWNEIYLPQILGLPPSALQFYRDTIIPAYLRKKETSPSDLHADDGVSYEEIRDFYQDMHGGHKPNKDFLRKEIMQALLDAQLIEARKMQNDSRFYVFKPLLSNMEEMLSGIIDYAEDSGNIAV